MIVAEKRFWIGCLVCPIALVGCLLADQYLVSTRVLTSFRDLQPLSPLYAFWIPAFSWRILPAIGVGVGYVAWIWLTHPANQERLNVTLMRVLLHMLWLGLFAGCLAAIRLPWTDLGAAMRIYPGEDFWDDVPLVQSPVQFLRDFNGLMAQNRLSLHGNTHPPGHTLFLWTVTQVFGASTQRAALSVLAVGATGLIPLYFVARRVFGHRVASCVLAVYPVVPGVALYAVSSTDFLFAGLAAWSLWVSIESLLGRSALVAACAGIAGGLAVMFSAAEVFIGMLAGLFAIVWWIDQPGTAVGRQLVWMLAGLSSWFAGLRIFARFDYLEYFRISHSFHRSFIQHVVEGLDFETWLYTSLGNALAFAWYLGIPLVVGVALSAVWTARGSIWNRTLDVHFARCLWAVVAIMACGGIFVLEVERIWLFLVGPVAALACHAMPQRNESDSDRRYAATIAGILAAQGILYESLFFTIW